MPPTFTNPVLTSRVAKDHFNGIKVEHADILKGIQEQSMRVNAYNQEKALRDTALDQARMQEEKDQQVAASTAQKEANEAALKQQELDIKRAALSSE
jgi:hypothetical protein